MFGKLFVDPRASLGEAMTRYRLRRPVIVVTLVALVNVLQTIAMVEIAGDEFLLIQGALFVLGAVQFLQAFLFWVVVTATVWTIVTILGGQARFGYLLKGVGLGMLPLIGTGVLWALAWYVSLGGSMPPEPASYELVEQWSSLQRWFDSEAVGEPAYVGLRLTGSLFVLASAYLWTVALDEISTLDYRKSAIAVAVPVLGYLLWVLSRVN